MKATHRKNLFGPALALSILLWAGCASGPTSAQVVILYTNDIHASFEPEKPKDRDELSGGILALDAMVRKIRSEEKDVLLLDAGDALAGHPVSAMEYAGVPGGAIFEMMSLVGYDAMELGNHDFDNGQEALAGLVKMARFQVLCANVDREDGGILCEGVAPSRVVEVGGVKIGLVGLVMENLAEVTSRKNTAGLRVRPPVEVARRIVEELDPQTDLVIAITHQDTEDDVALAEAVPGIDLIVGGHDHTALPRPRVVGGTLICKAGCKARQLGRLEVVVEGDRIARYENALLDLPHRPEEAGKELASLVDGLKKELDAKYQVPIGELKEGWVRNYYDESNLGDWVAASYAAAAGAQVGFVNSGSLRTDVPAGTLTVGDVVEVAPFYNTIAVFDVTGDELLSICRYNAGAAASQDHGILQVAGLAYSWRQTEPGEVEVLSATVGGVPVDPAATYRCASSDFVVFDQPEKYLGMIPAKRENLYLVTYEVLVETVRREREISVARDRRISRAP
ncbi:MAG: bifunctional metallophosphatase/5'-nucleotidase [Planctomycetes bacterium]|nr:bifunctional metallophosphatase/5'-nucleotidase [Planctomycetota bacterium]